MCKIAVIGSGNVGSHLHRMLQSSEAEGVECRLLSSRNISFADFKPEAVIICVKDDAIPEVAAKVKSALEESELGDGVTVAHTAGSVSMEALARFGRHGVFYPLQSFSKERPLDYSAIPFFIEGSSEEVAAHLEGLARRASGRVYRADSRQRRQLHLAAVFACNFANHLWSQAADILADGGYGFDLLRPLIEETLDKAVAFSPGAMQTGPAVRGDKRVVASHIDALQEAGRSDKAHLYRTISESIHHGLTNKEDHEQH